MAKNYSYRSFFDPLIYEQDRIEIDFEKRIMNQENGYYEIEIISVNGCSDILKFKKKLEDIIHGCLKELSRSLPLVEQEKRLELLQHMKGGLNESHFLFVTEESQPYFPMGLLKGVVQFNKFKALRNPKIKGNVPDDELEINRLQILSETSNYAKETEELILWAIRRVDFFIDQIEFSNGKGYSHYVNPERIAEMQKIKNEKFDLSRLIQLCEELNYAYGNKSYYSVLMLVRAIIDHIPPIFEKENFSDMSGSIGSRSFKEAMMTLDKSLRKIADGALHTSIRSKESLPNATQVDFSPNLDLLLAEIHRVLK